MPSIDVEAQLLMSARIEVPNTLRYHFDYRPLCRIFSKVVVFWITSYIEVSIPKV